MSQRANAAESAQSLLRELGDRAGRVRGRWWIPLAAGLVSAVLGLVVLSAGFGVGSLRAVTGVLFLVAGVALALSPAYAARTSGEHVLAGTGGALAGLILLAWPGPTRLVLVVFAGVWLTVSGGCQVIVSSVRRRKLPHWRFTVALGVIELLLGLWLLGKPFATVAWAATVVGVWAVVTGVISCVLAFEISTTRR